LTQIAESLREKARDALNTSHTVTSEQAVRRIRNAPEESLAFQSAQAEDTCANEVAEAVAAVASMALLDAP